MQNYNINRPFHLGRRDCFFEQGLYLIREAEGRKPGGANASDFAKITYCLKSACDHSIMAGKADNTAENEEHFLHFLQALMKHLVSLNAIMESGPAPGESGKGGELACFLETGAPDNAGAAREYREQTLRIVESVCRLCLLLDRPFQALKAGTIALLDESQKRVYETARDSLLKHLASHSGRRPSMYAQTAYPVL
ncbi:MAG: hypothetical protein GX608_00170 [Lentisphaerae bacterium]|nr:hypothetical protein [Lentisphaerota bacterium]